MTAPALCCSKASSIARMTWTRIVPGHVDVAAKSKISWTMIGRPAIPIENVSLYKPMTEVLSVSFHAI
jgi:hypothetical protein